MKLNDSYCVKGVPIRKSSGPFFPHLDLIFEIVFEKIAAKYF